MNKLFAFDLGTNSVGWTVLETEQDGTPRSILDAGVRIFSDGREPKSGTSLAAGRRVARGMARRRDRYKRRRKAVLRVLTEYGLMPDTPEARRNLVAETNDAKARIPRDVYALRTRALDEKLPLFDIGRALFHLNQRRGFKSNRRAERRDNEQGKIASGIARLQQAMDLEGARTLGEFLFKRRGSDPQSRGWVRVRAQQIASDGNTSAEGYGFYPQRVMVEREFDRIWKAQAAFYPAVLTEDRRAHLFRVMFYQRPLKRPEVGKCSFNPEESRLPKAHPLFQEFRLYKELNELTVGEGLRSGIKGTYLTLEQRDQLVSLMRGKKKSSFAALRKALKLPPTKRFIKESESRTDLAGDEVFAEMSHKTRFGNGWTGMTRDEQWQVIWRLQDTDDPLELDAWLEQVYGFEPDQRDAIADAKLPEGYGRLGETALSEILEELKAEVIPEAEAAKRAGYDHMRLNTGDAKDELPKYQEALSRRIPPGSGAADDPYDVRMGRITNPTVHIGLNQLRRVTNALIRRHGKPDQIAIELARELKLNDKQKDEINRTNAKNRRDAERRSQELREALHVEDNGYNRVLLKLWEELGDQPLNRTCVYCGQPISVSTLFSGEVDIDHILPWSRTLDDSLANRIVAHTHCNRQKGNSAPAEVPEWQGHYDEIIDRAERLRPNKRWRFAPDAMARFEKDRDFVARQLTDTQYLSRLAHEYLGVLFPDEEPNEWGVFEKRNHIRVVPGRLTEMLRRSWGLNSLLSDHNAKNRNDHRHHAIDAIVVGVTTRWLLQQMATAAGRGEALGEEDISRVAELPWPTFREDVKAVVDRIVVSHKADHGTLPRAGEPGRTAGQLHNDTAYGLTGESRNGVPIVVRRKPFLSLEPKDLGAIRDDLLRDHLETETYGLAGNDFKAALLRIQRGDPAYRGIRRVRVVEALNVIAIRDQSGVPYKAYKGDANYRYDVWELPNGRWVHEVVTMFEAHDTGWSSAIRSANPAARKVLSLHQNDMVAYEHPDAGLTIARVVKFAQSGPVTFAPHNEGGALKSRDGDREDSFKYFYKSAGAMRDIRLRQVRVDDIGRVFDPGAQDKDSRSARILAS